MLTGGRGGRGGGGKGRLCQKRRAAKYCHMYHRKCNMDTLEGISEVVMKAGSLELSFETQVGFTSQMKKMLRF